MVYIEIDIEDRFPTNACPWKKDMTHNRILVAYIPIKFNRFGGVAVCPVKKSWQVATPTQNGTIANRAPSFKPTFIFVLLTRIFQQKSNFDGRRNVLFWHILINPTSSSVDRRGKRRAPKVTGKKFETIFVNQ